MNTAIAVKTTIAEELEYLASENGGAVRPIDVLDYARDPDTALHDQFTWDDGDAAEQYRLWQARQVLRVYVKVEPGQSEDSDIRVFVSLPNDRKNGVGYRTLVDVMRSKRRRAELVKMALSELRTFRHNPRYRRLDELQPVWDAIDSVL